MQDSLKSTTNGIDEPPIRKLEVVDEESLTRSQELYFLEQERKQATSRPLWRRGLHRMNKRRKSLLSKFERAEQSRIDKADDQATTRLENLKERVQTHLSEIKEDAQAGAESIAFAAKVAKEYTTQTVVQACKNAGDVLRQPTEAACRSVSAGLHNMAGHLIKTSRLAEKERVKAVYASRRLNFENKTLSNIEKVVTFIGELKPATMITLIRNIIEGTTIQRITAIVAVFEQIGICCNADLISNGLDFITRCFVCLMGAANAAAEWIEPHASIKEELEAFTGWQLGDLDKKSVTVFSAALGFILFFTAGRVEFLQSKGKSFVQFLRGFNEFEKTFAALPTALNNLQKMVSDFLQFLGFEYEYDVETQRMVDDMKVFADRIEGIVNEIQQEPFKLFEGDFNTLHLVEEAKQFEDFYLVAGKGGELRTFAPIYTRIVTARTLLVKSVKAIDRSLGTKQQPASVWLWGQAGVGKSTAIHEIITQLEQIEGKPLTTYSRQNGDDFWSVYNQQDVIVFDDFGVDADDSTDAKELMRAVTSASFGLNMAALQEKGMMFKSRYVIIASNFDTTPDEKIYFDALDRRRHFKYMVYNLDVQAHLDQGGNLSDYPQNNPAFIPNIVFQSYQYTKTPEGISTHASEVQPTGEPPIAGRTGIHEIALRLHQRQMENKETFIKQLKRRRGVLHGHELGEHIAPGIVRDDIAPDLIVLNDNEHPEPSQQEMTDGLPAMNEFATQMRGLRHRPTPRNVRDRGQRRERQEFVRPRDPIDQAIHEAEMDIAYALHRERGTPPLAGPHGESMDRPIFLLVGEPGTGKTWMGNELFKGVCEKVQYDDPLPDPRRDNFREKCDEISEIIRKNADEMIPTVITLNDDRFLAFVNYLNESVDTFQRTMRRCRLFSFQIRKSLFKSKKTAQQIKEESSYDIDTLVEIRDPFKPCAAGKKASRLDIIDQFTDMVSNLMTAEIQKFGYYTLGGPSDVTIDLKHISVTDTVDYNMVVKNCSAALLSQIVKYRSIILNFTKLFGAAGFHSDSLEELARTITQLHIKAEVMQVVKVTLKEGDIYIAPIAGFYAAFVGAEAELKRVNGHLYWKLGDKMRKVDQTEIDFHNMIRGIKLELTTEEQDEIDLTIPPPVDVHHKIMKNVVLAVNAFGAMFTTGLIAANIYEMVKKDESSVNWPETRKGRAQRRAAMRDEVDAFDDWKRRNQYRDDEANDRFADDEYERTGNAVSRSRFKCRCRPDYDCALCSGNLPMWVTVEGEQQRAPCPKHCCETCSENYYSREPEPKWITVEGYPTSDTSRIELDVSSESNDFKVVSKRPKVRTESNDLKTTSAKAKIRTESNELKVKAPKIKTKIESHDYYKLLNSSQKLDGSTIWESIKRAEKHHLTGDDRFWCPSHVFGKCAGGKQHAHHTCQQCGRLVLKLWNNTDVRTRMCYECKGYSMPPQYVHAGCDTCKWKFVSEPEGIIDGSFRDEYRKIIKNSISFKGFFGLMLKGRLGVGPNHCLFADTMRAEELGDVTVVHRIPGKDIAFFTLSDKQREFPNITHFLLRKNDLIKPDQMCFYCLEPTGIRATIPVLVDLQQEVNVRTVGKIDAVQTRIPVGVLETHLTHPGDCGSPLVRADPTTSKKLLGIHVAGSKYYAYTAVVTREDVDAAEAAPQGLFEDVVLARDLFYDKPNLKWCPFLANSAARHYCGHCNRYVLTEMEKEQDRCLECQGLETSPFYVHKKSACKYCKSRKLVESEYVVKPTHQILPSGGSIGKTFEIVGYTTNFRGAIIKKFRATKTKLRVSPLRTHRFGQPWEPAVLDLNDPRNPLRIDPLLTNIDKWDIFRPAIDEMVVQAQFEEMALFFVKIFKNQNVHLKKMTIEEAVNRDTSHPNSNPIYLHSSAGFPYNTWAKVSHKFPMLQFYPELNRYKIDTSCPEGARLMDHIEYLIVNLRKGQKVGVAMDAVLKDEARPADKVAQIKTRSIIASPLCLTVVQRMLTNACVASIMETRHHHPIKSGIVANGTEWNDLFNYLTEHHEEGFDADYKEFDARVKKEEIAGIAVFYNTIYKAMDPTWKREDDIARTTLYQMLSTPFIIRDGVIVQSDGGQTSGHANTNPDNSLHGARRAFHCWQHYLASKGKPKHLGEYETYCKTIKTCQNGDDHIIMKHKKHPGFDFHFFKAFYEEQGILYQPPDKTSEGSDKHISEMTFLKRHFQFLPETGRYCVGALIDEAFCKMTSNSKMLRAQPYSEEMNFERLTFGQSLDTYILESALRGRRFYNETLEHVKEVCREHMLPLPRMMAWENCFEFVYHNSKASSELLAYDYL